MVTEKDKKYKIWEPLLLSLMVVIGMFVGAKLVGPGSGLGPKDSGISKTNYSGRQVEEIIRFLETKYEGDVSSDSLVEKAIRAIMTGLDPHTHYFPPDQMDELEERTGGHYVGIGVEIAFIRDSLMVLYPRKNSPAEKAGLRPGDFIVEVNGFPITSDTIGRQEVMDMIRGVKGTKVKLKIKPLLGSETKIIDINREEINVPSVVAAYMVDSTTAFIKIQRFTNSTYREFMDHWERMATTKGAKHLILDLRDNPGGYLKEAVNILSQIIEEEGKLLVYTEGKHQKRVEYKSTGKIFFPIEHVVVLINEGSASASEIIAGCLQDHDRAVIIGDRSYGKGLVQEQFELSNGGVLRLTVSKYYTPSGRLIQKAYDDDSKTDTTKMFTTSGGRAVYAGGGILPDVVLGDEYDWTNPMQMYWLDIISEYAIRYNNLHFGGSLESVEKIPELLKSLPPTQDMDSALMQLSKTYPELNHDSLAEFYTSNAESMRRLAESSLIAYRTGEEGWYIAMNERDPLVLKAKEMVHMDPLLALKTR